MYTNQEKEKQMDFKELLEKRRSVRDFEDKKVPLDLIKEIINDSIMAPNAGNRQIWSFIIINDKARMKALSDLNKKTVLAGIEKNPDSPMKIYEDRLRDKNYNVFYNAPSMIYIAGPAKAPTLQPDCALLASYFMLAAADRGLGTCWIAQGGFIRDQEVLKDLGLPEDHRIVAPIILGYPKIIPPVPDRNEPNILKIIS
jgi:nitroreductase